MTHLLDLSAALEQLKAELRDELLADLRGAQQADAWPQWMGVTTASRYLNVSEERVRKLVARGKIPYHQESRGCRVFLSRGDLDEWMASFRVTAGSGA
jgi:excisionase family DNA binding protein